MTWLSRLSGLPGSIKESWKKTFGDADVALEGVDAAADEGKDSAARPTVTLARAWVVLGVAPGATLDEVRAAARRQGQMLHPRVRRRDGDAERAWEEVIAASELLEEHLLPALRGSAPTTATTATTATTTPRGGRVRATPRAP